MTRVLLALGIVSVAAGVAAIVRRRRVVDPPSQATYRVPQQLDRADFSGTDVPWLVVVFSSATCDVCASMVAKARVLESPQVAFQEAEYVAHRSLHERYGIDAVPTTVIVDRTGVVVDSFVGPISATDLWVAVAGARDPSVRPERCERHE